MSTLNDKSSGMNARKVIIFLAFAIAFAAPNYSQYQFSPLGSQIIELYNLTPVQFNSIFTAPMLPAIFTSLICGMLVDRFGYKPVIGISVLLTFAGAWMRVFATGYAVMYIAMILIGFSAGFLSSNSSKILSQLFGAEKVSVMMGLVLTLSTCGLVLSMSTTTMLGSIRTAFVVAGVVCTVGLVLWFVVMPNIKPSKTAAAEDEKAPSLGEALRVVLRNPYVWLSGLALFCVNGAMTGMGSMVPNALTEVRGVSPVDAGVVGAFLMVGNLLGSLFTPTISLKTGKFRLVMMICGLISVFGCSFAWRAPIGIPLYLAMIVTGYTFGSGMAQFLSVAVQLPGVGPVYAGTAGGLIATLELLGGVVLPTYIASGIAGSNYTLYFIIIGLSSIIWIVSAFFLPKSLDGKPAKAGK